MLNKDNLLEPRIEVKLGDRSVTLLGNFRNLKNIQQFFNRDIMEIMSRITSLRQDEIVAILQIGSQGTRTSGDADPITEQEIGQFILELGLTSQEYFILRQEIMSWLILSTAPKVERPKKVMELNAMLEKSKGSVSRGQNTSNSV